MISLLGRLTFWLMLKVLVCKTLVYFSKLALLSEAPIFLEPATDLRRFIYSRSEWIKFSSFGSVKREFSWLPVRLNFWEAGD